MLRIFKDFKICKGRSFWESLSKARSEYKDEITKAKFDYEENRCVKLADDGDRNGKT